MPKVRNDDPVPLTLGLVNQKSVDLDTMSRITTVPRLSFKSLPSRVFVVTYLHIQHI